jgi:hypothetical protein
VFSVMERRPSLHIDANQDDMYNVLPPARLGRERLANEGGTSPNLDMSLARRQKSHAGQ